MSPPDLATLCSCFLQIVLAFQLASDRSILAHSLPLFSEAAHPQ